MKKISLFLLLFSFHFVRIFAQLIPANTADTYGYVWRDTSYAWVEIISNNLGTEVMGLQDDNVSAAINMGMTFKFYWNTYNKLYVGSNGYVGFTNEMIASSPNIGFPPIPSNNNKNDIISPMMCDFVFGDVGNPGNVYTYHDVASNRFIITFSQVAFWTNVVNFSGSNTYQIILDGNNQYIKFNYQTQQGNWDADYNSYTNPMIIGIENSTGQYGLFVQNQIKPSPNTSIVFIPPLVAGVTVKDAAPIHVQNAVDGGFFIKANGSVPLNAQIGNTGNVDITDDIPIMAVVKSKNHILLHTDFDTITALNAGANQNINFNSPFVADSASSYGLEVTTFATNDINSNNNSKTVEMVAIPTNSQNEEILSYITYGFPNSGISWTSGNGNSGAGIYILPYEYPTVIKAIEVVATKGSAYTPKPDSTAYFLKVFDDSGINGTIGQPLANDTILESDIVISTTTPVKWNRHDLASPIIVNSGGVYVAWIQNNEQIHLAAEDTFLASRRTYEISNNSWTTYRDAETNDLFIRLITEKTSDPQGILFPSQLIGLQVFPNPSKGIFTIKIDFEKAEDVQIKVLDLTGRKVFLASQINQNSLNQNIDLSQLSKGIYLLQIETEKGIASEKIVVE